MSTGGYNPIKWDCERNGCWNAACRPPIHFFCDCFPRKISMTDIDATVELNGHFLFLDWKSHPGELSTGQRIYFKRLSELSKRIVCIVVYAANNPNDVEQVKVIYDGHEGQWEPCTLDDLVERMRRWVSRVDIKAVA